MGLKMILIDMELPKGCNNCRFCDVIDDFKCTAMEPERDDVFMDLYVLEDNYPEKPDDCPLMEFKTGKWTKNQFHEWLDTWNELVKDGESKEQQSEVEK